MAKSQVPFIVAVSVASVDFLYGKVAVAPTGTVTLAEDNGVVRTTRTFDVGQYLTAVGGDDGYVAFKNPATELLNIEAKAVAHKPELGIVLVQGVDGVVSVYDAENTEIHIVKTQHEEVAAKPAPKAAKAKAAPAPEPEPEDADDDTADEDVAPPPKAAPKAKAATRKAAPAPEPEPEDDSEDDADDGYGF